MGKKVPSVRLTAVIPHPMKRLLFVVLLLPFVCLLSRAATPAYPVDGVVGVVKTLTLDWHDAARDRDVPVKIYYPDSADVCAVIVFSHGLGGSREGYGYLGDYWAAHGYVSVHVQHAGSDSAVWRDAKNPVKALRAAAANPANARNRPRDVSFALDQLGRLNSDKDSPLHGRLDLARVGLAGHSFGSFTTLATVTPSHPTGGYDPRIKAAVAMSTPAPKLPKIYAGIKIPVYHLTGTEDTDRVGSVKDAKDRRIPYDQTQSAPACLLTFEGGDHAVFSGANERKRKPDERDRRFHDLILRSTLAFWDSELKGKVTARAWLHDGDFAAALGKDGVFEQKNFD